MKKSFIALVLIFNAFICLFYSVSTVLAGSATLRWSSNSEPDLQGYKLYYGQRSRSYGLPVTLQKVTSYTVNGLTDGKIYYFALTAVDRLGNESGYSAEVSKHILSSNDVARPTTFKVLVDFNGSGTWDGDGEDRILVLGSTGDILVTGDWTGNGRTGLGVFREGKWHLDTNGDGKLEESTDSIKFFGEKSDLPVCGDWNGDGKTKIGVFRSGAWYLDFNGDGVWQANLDRKIYFGEKSDLPVCGDWNGDGKMDIGVFRSGVWYLDFNGDGVWQANLDRKIYFGEKSDLPVSGDWNGDGKTEIGVFRNALWFLDWDGNGLWNPSKDVRVQFGLPGDTPLKGDWNGNGSTKMAVFRGIE